MINVTIETGQWAKAYLAERVMQISLPQGTQAGNLASVLAIGEDDAGAVIVNGSIAKPGQILQDGDKIKMLASIIGG
ncbi:MAG: hypothetical protein FWG10_08375 [Eubacteriaceae bacterium]|nr:hypothetical protein [Eubacteriaceae bacterium]